MSEEVRRCKKCGCELTSKNKSKCCERCKRENAKGLAQIAAGFAGLGIGIVKLVSLIKPKK